MTKDASSDLARSIAHRSGLSYADIVALRSRYIRERDIRLRPDGVKQFPKLADEFARLADNPWEARGRTQGALHDDVEVTIVGGGFGGMLAGAFLRKANVSSIRIIESGGDFGGTWYWNRYPGAQCDVESYIYLPLLEDVGYMPGERYAYQSEIFEYCKAFGRHFDLYRDACFQTQADGLDWSESDGMWRVSTDFGDRFRSRYVILAPGAQSLPRLPSIRGISEFKGHTFHTSRWDYRYTGGATNSRLPGLAGQSVGVVGTGATAVQCVPRLAADAGHVYVFQRTPTSVSERGNRPTDPLWATSLEPGWQRTRIYNFTSQAAGERTEHDLIDDGWTALWRALNLTDETVASEVPSDPDAMAEVLEIADLAAMERVRQRVDMIVADPEMAAALKPYYRFLCKRPGFHDEFLDSFNKPNVTLVDTRGLGVERFDSSGAHVNGRHYDLDCIILATGFDVGQGYLRSVGFDVRGTEGRSLAGKWSDGLRTFHGLYSHGFPNMFFMGYTQTGISTNFVHTLTEQAEHLGYVIGRCNELGARRVEATIEAEEDWVSVIRSGWTAEAIAASEACTPSYFNNEGDARDPLRLRAGRYPGGPMRFFRVLSDWRAEGSMAGLAVR